MFRLYGKIGFNGKIDGYSFALSKIKTSLNGNFSMLEFNNYAYKNLVFNGAIQQKKFEGDLKSK